MALCPFHNDTRASLSISWQPNKWGLWYCFGCNRKGNIPQLLQALQTPITEPLWNQPVYKPPLAATLKEMLKPSRKLPNLPPPTLHGQLQAAQYLETKRHYHPNIVAEIVAEFYLYVGPNGRWKNFLIMPILNEYGQICYFTSRNVASDIPKTKNPTAPKKAALFGLYQTIQQFGHQYVILTEGPFDALKLISLNYPAVATLGQPNEQQCQLARKLFYKVYTAFDGDKQGQYYATITKKIIPNCITLQLPYHKDPDELNRKIWENIWKRTKLIPLPEILERKLGRN